MQVQARVAGGGADGDADEEWVQSGAASTRPDDHPVQEYLNSIELGEDCDLEFGAPERDDPDFWPKKETDWPRAVDEGRRTTRDQALKSTEHLLNFMDTNPDCMDHFKRGCGGAIVYLIGIRRGVEGCREPMGQRQATLPEVTAKAEKAGMRREILEGLDNVDKATLHKMIELVRGSDVR